MAQGVLPYQYQEETRKTGATAMAGLPLYLDLAVVAGLRESIERHVAVRAESKQGWTDALFVMALVLLNLAGGECVDDLDQLNSDEGFGKIAVDVETHGMTRAQRRRLQRRWRTERERAVPSPSAAFRYLRAFHDDEQERLRQPHTAFIPKTNAYLQGLLKVNRDLVAFAQSRCPHREATLDQDATLVETHKRDATFCYKGFQSYQPFNTYWAEHGLILHSEFRDGNVPAGHEQRRLLEESLAMLPTGVQKVYLRSDTAGYQIDLLKYCAEGKSDRFGVIEFAIGVDVTPAFKNAVRELREKDWNPIRRLVNGELKETGQQWAEVCFVPNWVGHSKKGPEYRFLAIREPLQNELPGLEVQRTLPFPTMDFESRGRHKLFGVVTNRLAMPGEELIWWHRKRCGKSEAVHAVMKDDLAGGQLPSALFGVNAAWWHIMLLALNLDVIMKRLVLGGSWANKRMKAMRFKIIRVAGWVQGRSRRLLIRLSNGHPALETLLEARRRIQCLANPAPG